MMVRNNIESFEDLMGEVKVYIADKESLAFIEKAFHYASKHHEGQFRKSGEPYMIHATQVGCMLASLKVGPRTIAAGLMHDVLEDCGVPREDMVAEFDEETTMLVEGVTKIGALTFKDEKEYQAANHRKIFIAMARDVRVIIIKLIDRLHNMRTLQYMSEEKQLKIASETLEVYAPIAHRLGISSIKNELEDLSFYYIDREAYYSIAKMVEAKKIERDRQVTNMIGDITKLLTENAIPFRIFGRSKHLYSIHKKMKTKNKRFEEILDLYAIRIVTKTELNCYEVLGYIHATYRPIPGRLKDYIAMPKMNMYQSLHTTIVGDEGRIFEVQIRTEMMDSVAEQGIAAHWRYKEGTLYDPNKEQKEIEQKLSWFRDLQLLTGESEDATEYMDVLQKDIFEANVYVMTPKGRVIDLPNGSTPVDFAYRVHTEVGHATVGAIVNETLVPLNTVLKTGDVVQIKTSKQFSGPSEGWLKFVKTSHAKNKIKGFLLKKEIENREPFIVKGESILKEELKKRGFDDKEFMERKKLEALYSQFSVSNFDDFMYAIAVKSISVVPVIERLTNQKKSILMDDESIQKFYNRESKNRPSSKTGLKVSGVDTMMISLAKCCSPVAGDEIVGYISKGKGVKVHRIDCPNIASEYQRLIDVEWDDVLINRKYDAHLYILSNDRNSLLTDLVNVTSQYKASLISVSSVVNSDALTVTTKMTILIENAEHLRIVMTNMKKISNVISVERVIQ